MSPADSPTSTRRDVDLIAACRDGHTQAFGELVTRYQDRVFNLAYRLTNNYDDAAEIAQEAFLKAYRALESFRGDCAFYTWVFRITVNTARSRWRFKAVRPSEVSLESVGFGAENDVQEGRQSLKTQLESDGPDPSEEAVRSENKDVVEMAIAQLSDDQRMLIVLRDIEGRDYGEISDILECPRGTVKSRLHRARAALKELLVPVLAESFESAGSQES